MQSIEKYIDNCFICESLQSRELTKLMSSTDKYTKQSIKDLANTHGVALSEIEDSNIYTQETTLTEYPTLFSTYGENMVKWGRSNGNFSPTAKMIVFVVDIEKNVVLCKMELDNKGFSGEMVDFNKTVFGKRILVKIMRSATQSSQYLGAFFKEGKRVKLVGFFDSGNGRGESRRAKGKAEQGQEEPDMSMDELIRKNLKDRMYQASDDVNDLIKGEIAKKFRLSPNDIGVRLVESKTEREMMDFNIRVKYGDGVRFEYDNGRMKYNGKSLRDIRTVKRLATDIMKYIASNQTRLGQIAQQRGKIKRMVDLREKFFTK